MNKAYLFVVLLLLVAPFAAQEISLSADQLKDTALLTTLNNYFGCKVWSNDACLQCSDRYYFNSKGVCCEVQGTCQQFNSQQGICEKCYEGYSIVDGKCVSVDTVKPDNIGCAVWKTGTCAQCSKRWYFNSKNVCVPISDLCSTWDEATGECKTCYYGYILAEGKCVENNDVSIVPKSNLLCKTWSGQSCVECADRTFFNTNGICTSVSALCNTFDKSSGNCLTCFAGYDLLKGQCVDSPSNTARPADLGCGEWDWKNQKCLRCSNRWAFNNDKVCVPVSDLCATNENGNCLTCYHGYDLKDGQCLFSLSNNAKPADSGCATWDWDNQKCLACSKRWAFNANKVCVPVSDDCRVHAENGECTQCFQGYDLKEGRCVFSSSNNAKPSDLGCGTWDWNKQVCLKCSSNWFFNSDKVCVPVSDQCKSSAPNGDCQTCYQGYDLKEGKCLLSAFNNAKPADSGCGTWDWFNQVCLKCSEHWVFNSNKVCVPVSDQCKTHNDNGECVSCFFGYDLKEGKCLFSDSNNAKPADSGCATWDWNNQKCLKCSNRWVFNKDGVCVPVADQCKTNAENGDCTSCFFGYDLKEGKCLFSDSNNAKPADSGCGTWDWSNQVCLKCSEHWVFNSNKVCVPVSDQCKTHNDNGECVSCFFGYDLKEGKCLFSDSNNAKPADSGCATWDWNNQKCLKCSNRWVFNKDGVCVPVADQCKTNAENGDCTSCFFGYDLKEGKCLFSDSNNAKPADSGCGTWDWSNQVCLKCSEHWVFNSNKVCVPVSDQCKTHNDNGECVSCFFGYDLKEGKCLFSDSNNAKPADSGCATWDWNNQKCLKCSKGWAFNIKNVCVAVSDLCRTNSESGDCTSCFQGYDLNNGQCVFSLSNNARPSDLGCATWDWKNQVCLKCSNRWFFNAKKSCVPVDDNCNTYSDSGSCTSCYSGYSLADGVCVSVNPLCKTLNTDGTCASCYPQNIVHKGNCVPISKLANILLYYAECCPQKLQAIQAAQAKSGY